MTSNPVAAQKPLAPPRSLGRMLNYATNACNGLAQGMLDEYDLTLRQWVILSALWRRDGQLVGELAAYSGTNAPAASRIVDRMVESGLLVREPVLGDRRAVTVKLTDKGKDLDHLQDFYLRVNTILFDGLSEKEAVVLFKLLDRVEQNALRTQAGDATA